MALDPYASCPCGSGKKFKWCCQPIYVEIDKAFQQDAEGQHDAALRTLDQVTAAFPDNPEAWGRKAHLLYQNNRVEEAENALQKAFEVNPNYPFGFFLQGMFRQNEGEFAGALLLFRKASELYDPEAKDVLGQLYSLIGDCELRLNRPVAARAAFQTAVHCNPANDELRKGFDGLFGEGSAFPASARKEYTFLSPPAGVDAERRRRWDAALSGAVTGKLADAVRGFEHLTGENADDTAAWYDLAVGRAWLGDNARAIEALDRYVTLEADEEKASVAWALGEVLRAGHAMDEQADYIEHSAIFRLSDPRQVGAILQAWEQEGRLVGVKTDEQQGFLTALVLEATPKLTPALAATLPPHLGAYLLIFTDRLRLWHTNANALALVVEELQQRFGPGTAPPERQQMPAHFNDLLAEALVFPVHVTNQEDAKQRVEAALQRFFEETWIHRPLRSLNLIPPVDAAGHTVLRRKLRGVVQFLQECATTTPGIPYDFDRLRRKLGLLESGHAPAAGTVVTPDIGAMSAAELAALSADQLADEPLEQAYQTAIKLDAKELAGRFAAALVARPPRAERPDRFPFYSHLIQTALAAGNLDEALAQVNAGVQADSQHNEGRRQNDYELRRAQVHAKRGDADEAQAIFERLIERVPGEVRYRGSATEAMLALKQPARALKFAEGGLAKAREKNERDSEEYFKELLAAAQRQAQK